MCRNPLCPLPCSRCSLLLDGWVTRCGRLLVVRRTVTGHRNLREHQDRDIARPSNQDATTRRLSVSAAVTWDTHRLVAQSQIQHFRSDRMAGTSILMFHESGLTVPHRETRSRPGPHPHRSTCYSSGPHLIFIF